MKTIYTRVPGLGEAFLQIGGAEGRRWLDASYENGEAQLWLGNTTVQCSIAVSRRVKAFTLTSLAFMLGFSVDIAPSEAGSQLVLSNATIAILQQLGL